MVMMVMMIVVTMMMKGQQRGYLHYGIVTFEAVDAVVDVVRPLRETMVSELYQNGGRMVVRWCTTVLQWYSNTWLSNRSICKRSTRMFCACAVSASETCGNGDGDSDGDDDGVGDGDGAGKERSMDERRQEKRRVSEEEK
jgi:hypothetical protein